MDVNDYGIPEYDDQILDVLAGFVDRFSPGTLTSVDAPHFMEVVAADAIRLRATRGPRPHRRVVPLRRDHVSPSLPVIASNGCRVYERDVNAESERLCQGVARDPVLTRARLPKRSVVTLTISEPPLRVPIGASIRMTESGR